MQYNRIFRHSLFSVVPCAPIHWIFNSYVLVPSRKPFSRMASFASFYNATISYDYKLSFFENCNKDMKWVQYVVKCYVQFLLKLYSLWYRLIIRNDGHLHIHGKACIISPQNIEMGKNCSINPNVYINAMNPVKIGDNVTLSAGSSIISASLDVNSFLSGGHAHVENDGISIGNNVWIGANATILGGAKTICDHVIIAAGAVVTKDITESYTVWGGVNAKLIKRLTPPISVIDEQGEDK